MSEKKDTGPNYTNHRIDSGFNNILITPRLTEEYLRNQGLTKFWDKRYIWALGVGTAIPAAYLRWSRAFGASAPVDFLAALVLVSLVYFVFMMVLAELGVNFPYAGGPYAYARRGFGMLGGYSAGVLLALAQMFALAAVLTALRGFLALAYPGVWGTGLSLMIFAVIVMGQVLYLKISAILQMVLTCCALSGIVLYLIGTGWAESLALSMGLLQAEAISMQGIIAALPLVFLFYMGMEILPTAAEETKDVSKNLPLGIFFSLGTTVMLTAAITLTALGAVPPHTLATFHYPLGDVLKLVQAEDAVLLTTFSAVSIFAFAAGINGLISGYSRQIYALARAGYFPEWLSRLDEKRRTPVQAVLIPAVLVVVVFMGGGQDVTITGALFFTLLLQLLVLVTFLRIYRVEPQLFHVAGFLNRSGAVFLALLIATGVLLAVVWQNRPLVPGLLLLLAIFAVNYYFRRGMIREDAPEESRAVSLEKRIEIHFH